MVSKIYLIFIIILFSFNSLENINIEYPIIKVNKTIESENNYEKIKEKITILAKDISEDNISNISKAINKIVAKDEQDIFISIISVESEFKPKALSAEYNGHRDFGLCQISSKYHKFDMHLIYDEEYNIKKGYDIFSETKGLPLEERLYRYNGSKKYYKKVYEEMNKLLLLTKEKDSTQISLLN